MKIIDLLNKIAKGEEVPKKVWFDGRLYEYEEECNMAYRYKYRGSDCTLGLFGMIDNFNDEIEIIEEAKWDYTIRQISKMIASGDLKDIYEKYLSNCPIGFMKEEDIYNYILKNFEVGTIEEDKDIKKLNAKYTSQIGKIELANKIDEIIDTLNELKKNER